MYSLKGSITSLSRQYSTNWRTHFLSALLTDRISLDLNICPAFWCSDTSFPSCVAVKLGRCRPQWVNVGSTIPWYIDLATSISIK